MGHRLSGTAGGGDRQRLLATAARTTLRTAGVFASAGVSTAAERLRAAGAHPIATRAHHAGAADDRAASADGARLPARLLPTLPTGLHALLLRFDSRITSVLVRVPLVAHATSAIQQRAWRATRSRRHWWLPPPGRAVATRRPRHAIGGQQPVKKCRHGIFQPRQVRSKASHGSQNNDLRRYSVIASMRCRSLLNSSTGCYALPAIASARIFDVLSRMMRGSTVLPSSSDLRTSLPEMNTGFSSLWFSIRSTRPSDS